ncbi:hypothetical protein ACRAWF_22385 [Streptomyces sp. L7]
MNTRPVPEDPEAGTHILVERGTSFDDPAYVPVAVDVGRGDLKRGEGPAVTRSADGTSYLLVDEFRTARLPPVHHRRSARRQLAPGPGRTAAGRRTPRFAAPHHQRRGRTPADGQLAHPAPQLSPRGARCHGEAPPEPIPPLDRGRTAAPGCFLRTVLFNSRRGHRCAEEPARHSAWSYRSWRSASSPPR